MNFSSPLTDVKPLFSPGLPRPGGIIEELWTSREVRSHIFLSFRTAGLRAILRTSKFLYQDHNRKVRKWVTALAILEQRLFLGSPFGLLPLRPPSRWLMNTRFLSEFYLTFTTGLTRQSIPSNSIDQPPILWKFVLNTSNFPNSGASATKLP